MSKVMSAVKTNNSAFFSLISSIKLRKANIQTTQKHSFLASKTVADKGAQFYFSITLPFGEIFFMDSAQWTQDFGAAKSMAELGACTRPTMEKKIRPQKDLALNCPRCHSTNTKFCYYNNYSLTQPRYFCKTCRRYWTEGGTLRNVPVGGGSRKNMKKSSSTPHPTTPSHKLPDLNPPSISQFSDQQNPNKFHDLNLGFSQDYHIPQFIELPKTEGTNVINTSSSSTNSSSTPISALNFLRHGGLMINTFNPMAAPTEANAMFAPSFPFQECKASLSFPVDGININGDRYTNPNLHQESNGSLMFTLGGGITKQNSSTGEGDHGDKGRDNSNGFWSGMLGGGSW